MVANISQLVRWLMIEDRNALVGALKEWLSRRKDPETMVAISIAKEYQLFELVSDLNILEKNRRGERFLAIL